MKKARPTETVHHHKLQSAHLAFIKGHQWRPTRFWLSGESMSDSSNLWRNVHSAAKVRFPPLAQIGHVRIGLSAVIR